jgi:mannose-1-phosphate guanylyltransferase
VLVGGEGTRLRPLTFTTPKPLLPIAGQPFLERQLTWLAGHGVTEVVLALGYLPDAFAQHFTDDMFEGMRLRYAVEPEPLGTAGGIRFAAAHAGIDDRFVVCNGDVLTTLDLSEMMRFHAAHDAEATIHLTRVADPSAFGVVPTFEDGEVKAFVEKPASGSAPTDWINAGTYVLEPSVLDRIPPGLTVSIERETFPRMLDERGRLYATGTDDYWLDIGTPEKYLQAHLDVVLGATGVPPVAGAREAEPGIWLRGEQQLAPDARMDAPLLVDDGVTIESGARVSESTLGAGCFVDVDAVVEQSVLLEGARIGSGARALASIIGPGACIEADAVVLDRSILGAGAHVAAGTTVARARVPLAAPTG